MTTDTTRDAFEAWAVTILGDNPNWRETGNHELAWQSWQAATAQGKRQPLTVERLFANVDLMALNAEHGMLMPDIVKIVRVIEAAHGITATPQGTK